MWEWFVAARAVAGRLQNITFSTSVSWLSIFKERHGIDFNQVSGEAKNTDEGTVNS